jgi:hypothetical protein
VLRRNVNTILLSVILGLACINLTLLIRTPARTRCEGIIERIVFFSNNIKSEATTHKLKGGELSLGSIPQHNASFLLPVIVTINKYLSNKQIESLNADEAMVLTRYELLEAAFDNYSIGWQGDVAYLILVRLFYSEFDGPPGTIRLFEEDLNGGRQGGVESPFASKNWYEDVVYVIRSLGDSQFTEINDDKHQKIIVQGKDGWYVDTDAIQVLNKVEINGIPPLFSVPLPMDNERP